jgi:hypothetical protein
MQAERQQRAAAHKRWWEFWRFGEDSLTLASKKHDSMVAAAGSAAGPPAAAVLQNKEATDAFGLTPVVLDAGVLQEEQRMKAALFGGQWCASESASKHITASSAHCQMREQAQQTLA